MIVRMCECKGQYSCGWVCVLEKSLLTNIIKIYYIVITNRVCRSETVVLYYVVTVEQNMKMSRFYMHKYGWGGSYTNVFVQTNSSVTYRPA